MGRWVYYSTDEFCRFLGNRYFEGVEFFETKDIAKMIAKKARKLFAVQCRAITIPKSGGLLGYDDRYLVMLPIGSNDPVEMTALDHAEQWIKEQDGKV